MKFWPFDNKPEKRDAQAKPNHEPRERAPAPPSAARYPSDADMDAVMAATQSAIDALEQARREKRAKAVSNVMLFRGSPFLLEMRSERMMDALLALDNAGFDVVQIAGAPNRFVIRDRVDLEEMK